MNSPRFVEEKEVVGNILIEKIVIYSVDGAVAESAVECYVKANVIGGYSEARSYSKSINAKNIEFESTNLTLGLTSSSITSTMEISLWKKFATGVDILVGAGVVELQRAIRQPNEFSELSSVLLDNGKSIASVLVSAQFVPKKAEEASPSKKSPTKIGRPFSAFGSTFWK